jgi:all-trans-8'-apo-beta-carotenal 15,15'-oxygenase
MTSVDTRPTAAASYRVADWQRGYESLNTEHSYTIENIEGEIPADLEGTLFRNGPGKLDVNGTPLQHPFDGDGMVCAITFKDGKATFRNRYVRTEGFFAECLVPRSLEDGWQICLT